MIYEFPSTKTYDAYILPTHLIRRVVGVLQNTVGEDLELHELMTELSFVPSVIPAVEIFTRHFWLELWTLDKFDSSSYSAPTVLNFTVFYVLLNSITRKSWPQLARRPVVIL